MRRRCMAAPRRVTPTISLTSSRPQRPHQILTRRGKETRHDQAPILGAAGEIAQHAIQYFRQVGGNDLTPIYGGRSGCIAGGDHVRLIEGDVTDTHLLEEAARGQDVVYANLVRRQYRRPGKVRGCSAECGGVRRLIWISTLVSTTRFPVRSSVEPRYARRRVPRALQRSRKRY